MPETVRETRQMLALMNPLLDADDVVFCTTADKALAEKAGPLALGSFREAEGVSLILPRAAAEALGFPVALPMRQIKLTVNSALDGVGLTAAVASALAAEGVPCNVVAAFHHDHIFVPAAKAEMALAVVKALQDAAAPRGPKDC